MRIAERVATFILLMITRTNCCRAFDRNHGSRELAGFEAMLHHQTRKLRPTRNVPS
jgi:hypothetical protein